MRHLIWLGLAIVGCGGRGAPSSSPTSVSGMPAIDSPARPGSPAEPRRTSQLGRAHGALDPSGAQGVRGEVVRVEGDFMPPVPEGFTGLVTPIPGRVFVFRGKLAEVPQIDPDHPALVTTVRTDAHGKYTVSLTPGTYTIVAEIDGRPYLNSFDGQGHWSSVDVVAGVFTAWRIVDDSRATY